jgi:hypothetical protein
MDILLNLKLETAMLENKSKPSQYNDAYINSSRGGHGAPNLLDGSESHRTGSEQSSSMTQRDGPP